MTSFKAKNYFKQLDAVRGILAIVVFTTHLKLCSIYLAYGAMHIFFILSTFLVSKSLLSDQRKNDNLAYNTKLYLLKRVGRIAPVYFIYLAIIFCLGFIAFHITKDDATIWTDFKQFGWMHLLFIYNFREVIQLFTLHQYDIITYVTPHLWSVSFEMQLYIIIFIFIYFFKKETLIKFAYFFIPFIALLRIVAYYLLLNYTSDQQLIVYLIQRNPLFHIDIFFFGVLLVFIPLKNETLIRNLLVLFTIILLSIGIGFPYITSQTQSISYADAIHQDKYIYAYHGIFYIDIVINCFTFLLVGYLINFPNQIKLFGNQLLIRLGEFSYPTYIFQMLLIAIGYLAMGIWVALKIAKISQILFYVLSAISMWLVAYYGSKFIHNKLELPLLNKKDKYIDKYIKKHQTNLS